MIKKKHPKRQPITDQTGADRTNDNTRNIPQKQNKKACLMIEEV